MFSQCFQTMTRSKARPLINSCRSFRKTHLSLVIVTPPTLDSFTSQRQELESENKKLKHNLAEMRQSLLGNAGAGAGAPGSPAYKVLLEQLNASCEELDVRKEEVLILRSQLVSQKEAMHHKVEERFTVSVFSVFKEGNPSITAQLENSV